MASKKRRKRRNFKPEFKARIAKEALRGVKTAGEIADEHDLHPAQVSTWKKELEDRIEEIFSTKKDTSEEQFAKERDQLHRQIGQLSVEVDFLKKSCRKLGIPLDD